MLFSFASNLCILRKLYIKSLYVHIHVILIEKRAWKIKWLWLWLWLKNLNHLFQLTQGIIMFDFFNQIKIFTNLCISWICLHYNSFFNSKKMHLQNTSKMHLKKAVTLTWIKLKFINVILNTIIQFDLFELPSQIIETTNTKPTL